MSNDATPPETDDLTTTALGEADSLDEVPAAAGGNDDSEPAQGEGESNAF